MDKKPMGGAEKVRKKKYALLQTVADDPKQRKLSFSPILCKGKYLVCINCSCLNSYFT